MVSFFMVNRQFDREMATYLPSCYMGFHDSRGLPTSLGSKSTQNGDRNEKLENLGPSDSGNKKRVFPRIGVPQIIHFNRVFHYKPSILGYPYFWKHPNGSKTMGRS